MKKANEKKTAGKLSFDQVVIFYFSGTGNSRRIAKWMAESIPDKKAKVINIENKYSLKSIQLTPHSLLGLVFPVQAFIAPWIVIKFAFGLPRDKSSQSFLVTTRGRILLGSIPIPGFAGIAYYLIALIMLIKGYRIKGLMGVDMPSNWIWLHSGSPKKDIYLIEAGAKPKVQKFINKILLLKSHFVNRENIIEFVFGLALFPVSICYLLFGNFIITKVFYASNKCEGCYLCEKNCPTSAIKMYGKKNPRPYWTFKCQSCMRCINYCPNQAIEISYPFAIITAYICTTAIFTYFLHKLFSIIPWINAVNNYLIRMIINWCYIAFMFFIFYIIFYYLIRIPFINILFTTLSPVHYYRRYREPNTRISDFKKDK